jgi:hypothetical protein
MVKIIEGIARSHDSGSTAAVAEKGTIENITEAKSDMLKKEVHEPSDELLVSQSLYRDPSIADRHR